MSRRTVAVAGVALLAALAALLALRPSRDGVGSAAAPCGTEVRSTAPPAGLGATPSGGSDGARPGAVTPWLGTPARPLAASPEPSAPPDVATPAAGPPPALTGAVVTDDWFRVPDVEVLLTRERPVRERRTVRLAGAVLSRAWTDPEGRFSFASVPDAEFHLVVLRATHPLGGDVAPAYVTVPARAAGAATRSDDVTVRLLGRPTVWVLVTEPEGAPLARARVTGAWFRGVVETGGDGWAPVPMPREGDAPASEVRVEPPASRSDLQALETTVGAGELALTRGRTVAGTVLDAQGRPVPRALLRYSLADPWGADARIACAGEDGTFLLGALRGTSVTIWATAMGGGDLEDTWGRIRVPVDTPDARIVLPPLARLRIVVHGAAPGVAVHLRPLPEAEGAPRAPAPDPPSDPRFDGAGPSPDASVVRFTDASGRVEHPSLRADRAYVAWMEPDAQGRTFVLRDVRPAEREVEVTAELGNPTAVRVAGTGWVPSRVWATDDRGVVFQGNASDPAHAFPGLPEGTWRVVARLTRGGFFNDTPSTRSFHGSGERTATVETTVLAGGEAVIEPPR